MGQALLQGIYYVQCRNRSPAWVEDQSLRAQLDGGMSGMVTKG